MDKERISAKELKDFLKNVSDDAIVELSTSNGKHHKEFIVFTEYNEEGRSSQKEICIVSSNIEE